MSIFLTGATGFLGGHLLPLLIQESQGSLVCLTRQHSVSGGDILDAHVEFVQGDVCDRQSLAPYLQRCETVIHMAAATGQGGAEDFYHANTEGTKVLLEECRHAGVKNVLFVSTIAVTFEQKHNYYYALSKEQAEALVRESGMRFSIIRPTIIIGLEGKAWQGLAKFAKSPILVIPGNGLVQIQPIYVDDLARCLMNILREDLFNNETYEMGGPEVISMRGFLNKVYTAYHGKLPAISIPIPVQPIQVILSMVESVWGGLLPVSAGQLSSFRNDGVASENVVSREWRDQMKTVDEMIGLSVESR